MRRLVLALSAVSVLACGDSSGPEVSSAVGTWNLVTVNGSPLPYTLFLIQPTYRFEILSNVFVAAENGTYTETETTRETESGTVTTTTETDNGTWSQTGNTVTVVNSGGATTTATISGNSITVSAPGLVAVFHRQ
jgi:hypothetical protein